jgi:UDP:flavonoid glycosyltransferase YjiC (YdhE family)
METKRILYISGSLGLGHITRDLAIAAQLRELISDVEIEWLAANPATDVLCEAGEKLVPGAEQYANENQSAEKVAKGASLNLLSYLLKSRGEWKKNIAFFLKLISERKYDLVIGDETYEINLALREHPEVKNFPFVLILDFVGLDAMTRNPLERLGVYYWNRVWSHDYRLHKKPPYDLALFVGEPEDVPDKSFGFGLPNRRELAKALYTFVGYVFPFNPEEFTNKMKLKKELGYSPDPLLICSIGGTAIGKELMEFCGKACDIIIKKRPDIHAVFVTGPRLDPANVNLPSGFEVKGFVPRLYQHFAASDIAVIQGGATSAFELAALQTPFVYFPLEGHCEQANVSRILTKRGIGLEMNLSTSTPEMLAKKIISTLGTNPTFRAIPTDGARKAAEGILNLLRK